MGDSEVVFVVLTDNATVDVTLTGVPASLDVTGVTLAQLEAHYGSGFSSINLTR